MRQALAVLLITVLAAPCSAGPKRQSVKEQAVSIARDAAVEVRFTNGTKQRGRLGAVSDSGFELQTERNGTITKEQVAFERVKSVRGLRHESTGRSIGRTFLITGIVVGTVFGVIVLVVALAMAAD
ncbi:MAG: hypothetical protein U0R19_13115 [Bryobacteraceae bacterium]